jgi:arabinogalactan oligomer/maltooligosaccharide transport system permease protein
MEAALKRGKQVKLGKQVKKGIMGQKKWTPFWFLWPSVFIIVAVVFYPLAYEFIISFQNITLINFKSGRYPFVFLENYQQILSDRIFYTTLIRTVIWTVTCVFFHVVVGVFLAVLLNRKLPGKSVLRILLILPWAMPQYVVAMTWRGMFNYEYGAINIVLKALLGEGAAVSWLSDPGIAFIAAIITNIWLGIPFMMMISLGGLQSVPRELYEAAEIDGSNALGKFFNITLPLLKPILTPAVVLGTVWTFNMVNVIYIITWGSSSEDAQILISLVYKRAFEYYRFGYSAALSVIIFVILLSFSTFFIRAQKLEEVD